MSRATNRNKIAWYKEEFKKINKILKNRNYLTYHNFLRIRNFKLQNFSTETEKNIKRISKEAFVLARKNKIEKAITKLIELNGVGIPTASAILAMKLPREFAIIDINVITALGKKEWEKNYLNDSSTYKEYLCLLKKRKGWKTLRDYELHLFEKGRELKRIKKKRERKLI